MEIKRSVNNYAATDHGNTSKLTAMYPPCYVCNGPANGIHYGVNTCDACKGFFHRSLRFHHQYKCQEDGKCVIQYGTGKICQMCRYQKCLAVGLSKNGIRRGRYKKEMKIKFMQQAKQCQRENGLVAQSQTINKYKSHTQGPSISRSIPSGNAIFTPRSSTRAITRVDSIDTNPYKEIDVPPAAELSPLRSDSSATMSPPDSTTDQPSSSASSSASHPLNPGPTTAIHPNQNWTTSHSDPYPCHSAPCSEASPPWSSVLSPSSKESSTPPGSNLSEDTVWFNLEELFEPAEGQYGHFMTPAADQQEQEDIVQVYSDGDAVTKRLVEAYDLAFEGHAWTREEAINNTREHYETCKLQSEMFGRLHRLVDEEYDTIFYETGIDADERQKKLDTFSKNIETFTGRIVNFVKAIPGFADIPLKEKIWLIKYTRLELSLLHHYPSANMELGIYRCSGLDLVCPLCAIKDSDNTLMTYSEYKNITGQLQKIELTYEECVLLSAVCVTAPDRFEMSRSTSLSQINKSLIRILMKCLAKRVKNPVQVYSQYLDIRARFINLEVQIKKAVKGWSILKYVRVDEKPLFNELAIDFFYD